RQLRKFAPYVSERERHQPAHRGTDCEAPSVPVVARRPSCAPPPGHRRSPAERVCLRDRQPCAGAAKHHPTGRCSTHPPAPRPSRGLPGRPSATHRDCPCPSETRLCRIAPEPEGKVSTVRKGRTVRKRQHKHRR